MHINVLTPGFETSNGSAFLFPLIVFKNEIQDAGINITLVDQSYGGISDADVVAIDSKQFRDVPLDQQSEIQELINSFRRSNVKIIWFDTTDSTGTLQADMFPVIDKYMKAQILKDKTRYEQRIYSGREHSEYYFNTSGIIDTDSVAIDKPISSDDISKLGISWNSGLADYSTYGPLKMGLYRRIHWSSLLSYPTASASHTQTRKNDLSARFGVRYNKATVRYQREQIRKLLCDRFNTNKVNRREYIKELRQSKIVLAPFGWGEITLKDFEVFLTGGMLLKPSMEHMETWPNFYSDGITYRSHDWNLSNLEEEIEWALENHEERQAIAAEGHYRYLQHTSGHDAAEIFVTHLTAILSN